MRTLLQLVLLLVTAGAWAAPGLPYFAKTLQSEPIPAGLVLWWKFDEGAGNTAQDSSGHSNTGTIVNAPAWLTNAETKHFGGALYFNGASQWVVRSNATAVPTGNAARTFSCWAYTLDNYVAISQYAVSSGYPNDNTCFLLGLNQMKFIVSTAGVANDCKSSVLALANTWYHLVGTYTNGVESIYTNGVLCASKSITSTATSDSNVFAAKHAAGEYWNGYLDDVRIYDRVLTDAEITNLYNWRP